MKHWLAAGAIARLDETVLDYHGVEDQVPPDCDIPVAWTKLYGSGRVFASSLGHTREAYADPDIARLYSKAIRWTLGLTSAPDRPHLRPAPAAR